MFMLIVLTSNVLKELSLLIILKDTAPRLGTFPKMYQLQFVTTVLV